MPGSHWLITLSPENFRITREGGFSLLGMHARHRKKAERMVVGDRVLYYVLQDRLFPASVTVSSTYFEDRTPVWGKEEGEELFPYRVHTRPAYVLQPWEGLDAAAVAPRLQYLKRWPPEQWFLALQGEIHLLSAQDFQLIEHELRRVVEGRATRREKPPGFRGERDRRWRPASPPPLGRSPAA